MSTDGNLSYDLFNSSWAPTYTEDGSDSELRYTLAYIRASFVPIIIAGTVTNVMNFVVLTKPKMRRLSTACFLLALAIADLGVLYVELFRVWFEWLDFIDPTVYFTDIYCKVMNFLNGITRDFSNWLIACVTVERLVMVIYPYKARRFCTVKNARVAIISLLVCIICPHTHCIVFSTAQNHVSWVCWEDPKSFAASVVSALVEFLVGYTVVIIVFMLNMVLIYNLYNSKRLDSLRPSRSRRLTRMLLIVAIVFIVCETPRIILSFVCRFVERTPRRRIFLNISYALSGINHASNFFIYILSSPSFRILVFDSLRMTFRLEGAQNTVTSDRTHQSGRQIHGLERRAGAGASPV